MQTKTATYYRATAPNPINANRLDGDKTAEVCIIGGGYAGLAAAKGLLDRGVDDIILLEGETIGHGCSGRNGGFVFAGFNLDEEDLIRQVGITHAQRLYRHSQAAAQMVRDNIENFQIDCEMNTSGILLANWFDRPEILHDYQHLMKDSFGMEFDEYGLEDTRGMLKSTRYYGALRERGAFHIHPLKYIEGVAHALINQGLRVFENSPALRFETDQSINGGTGGHIVHTATGTVRAKTIIMTGSAYMQGISKAYDQSQTPVATYVMATEPLGDRLKTAIDTEAAVYDTRFDFDYYRPLADTRILWGGRISALSMNPPDLQDKLYSDLMRVYPQLEGVKIEYAWHGIMSYARHKMPVIGRPNTGVWFTHGFGGHGVALTHLFGDMIAGAVANGDTTYRDFSDHYGLKNSYGMLGRLAAEATYRYYILRDKIRG